MFVGWQDGFKHIGKTYDKALSVARLKIGDAVGRALSVFDDSAAVGFLQPRGQVRDCMCLVSCSWRGSSSERVSAHSGSDTMLPLVFSAGRLSYRSGVLAKMGLATRCG
mgnify:CR=1 FL=1